MTSVDDICKSFHVAKEMLNDRKIFDPQYANINIDSISPNEIREFAHKQTFSIDVSLSPKIRIIYLLSQSKFTKQEIRDIHEKHMNDPSNDPKIYIIIVKDKLTGNNIETINTLVTAGEFQIFEFKELLFNISRHVLVPKHEIIDESEINSILQKNHLKHRSQLPHILKTDPMARYLGLKSGMIVKITRPSPSAGEYTNYRCCI